MKLYKNNEGKLQHFIGAIPENFREVTQAELEAFEAENSIKEQRNAKLETLLAIYEAQDEYLKAQFEPAKNKFIEYFIAGNDELALKILQSPYISAELKPIVDSLLTELTK